MTKINRDKLRGPLNYVHVIDVPRAAARKVTCVGEYEGAWCREKGVFKINRVQLYEDYAKKHNLQRVYYFPSFKVEGGKIVERAKRLKFDRPEGRYYLRSWPSTLMYLSRGS